MRGGVWKAASGACRVAESTEVSVSRGRRCRKPGIAPGAFVSASARMHANRCAGLLALSWTDLLALSWTERKAS